MDDDTDSSSRRSVAPQGRRACRLREPAAMVGPTTATAAVSPALTDMSGLRDRERDHTSQHRHGVVIEIPGVVKREAEVLQHLGCTNVLISSFDRTSGIWTINFTQDQRRRALMLWTLEVDA